MNIEDAAIKSVELINIVEANPGEVGILQINFNDDTDKDTVQKTVRKLVDLLDRGRKHKPLPDNLIIVPSFDSYKISHAIIQDKEVDFDI